MSSPKSYFFRKFQKTEIITDDRFAFGKNWKNYLESLTEDNIVKAEKSFCSFTRINSLNGMTFLDAGCGSGLHSLVARRLGAEVFSFDYDSDSVGCTKKLRELFDSNDNWKIEQGSAIDENYMASLGQFDFVYSWGVLHHTGDMWKGLGLIEKSVKDNGYLFIAIYNDQNNTSKRWRFIKQAYNKFPLSRILIVPFIGVLYLRGRPFLIDLLKLKNPFARFANYKENRGMSVWHDTIDWLGGYPFEVATPDQIFNFYHKKGYKLINLKTCGGGLGCNEFLFKKEC